MTRPVVLLSAQYDSRDRFAGYIDSPYTDSVRLAGGIPVIVPFQTDDSDIDVLLDHADALIMTGGPDVDPSHYGEPLHPKTSLKYEKSQHFDLELVRRARARSFPVLGICLGAQQLNVACGGTLYQDLPDQLRTDTRHRHTSGKIKRALHPARIEPGTRLFDIIGQTEITVNSSHHQGIKDLGRDLRVSALSPDDGVIEAVEDLADRFFLGVQWHPEALAEPGSIHLKLFESLIRAVRRT